MYNILFVSSRPSDRGGVAVWANSIIDHKSLFKDCELNFVYTMQYSNMGAKKTFFEKYIKSFFDVHRIKKEVKKAIKEKDVDLIHVVLTGGPGLLRDLTVLKIAKKYAIKTVIHLHFGTLPLLKQKNNFIFKLFKKCYLLSDSAWCLDQKTLDVCNSLGIRKNYLVPNFIDCSSTCLINNKTNLITFVGWVTKTKGVEELFEAWDKLSDKLSHFKLQVIGPVDSKYREELQNNFNLNNVEFLGKLSHEEVLKGIGKSKLFVLPSYTEGFPLVILEAMTFGVPVISTDVGCIKDILSGDCGLVGKPRDSIFIENAILKLLTNHELYDKISKNSYRKVREIYDVNVVLKQYVDAWKEILNGK